MCDLSLFSCVFDKPLFTGNLDYSVEPLSQRLPCLGHLQVDVNPSLCLVTEGNGGPGQALPALPAALVAVHPDQSRQHLLQIDENHLLPRKDVYHGLAFSLAHRFPLHETAWQR